MPRHLAEKINAFGAAESEAKVHFTSAMICHRETVNQSMWRCKTNAIKYGNTIYLGNMFLQSQRNNQTRGSRIARL